MMNNLFKSLQIAAISVICLLTIGIKCNAATVNLSTLPADQECNFNEDTTLNLDVDKTIPRITVNGILTFQGDSTLTIDDTNLNSYISATKTVINSGNVISTSSLNGSFEINGGSLVIEDRYGYTCGILEVLQGDSFILNGGTVEASFIHYGNGNTSIRINGGHLITGGIVAKRITISDDMFVLSPWNAAPATDGSLTSWASDAPDGKIRIVPRSEVVFVTGIAFQSSSGSYKIGDSFLPDITVSPANATNKNITYSIDNASVATIAGDRINITGYGEATLTATSIDGNYTASYKINVPDTRESVENASVTLSKSVFSYDGSEKKPAVTVILSGKTLTEGIDYAVDYQNNINIGTAYVMIEGKNTYKGTVSIEFHIVSGTGNTYDGDNTIIGDYTYVITDTDEKEVEVDGMNISTDSVIIPATVEVDGDVFKVTSIGEKAFYRNTKIKSITIPNTVKSVENYAFYGCTKLTTIKIGNGLDIIGANAFRKCTKLTSITLPKSLDELGKNAFYGCSKLKIIIIKSNAVIDIKANAIKGIAKKAVIKVPKKLVNKYKKKFTSKTGYKKTMTIKKK